MKRNVPTNRCAWARTLCPIVLAIGAAAISITICCVPFARGQQSARGKQKVHVKKNANSVSDDQKIISEAGSAAPNLSTVNYETIELAHNQKVRVEKWGDTFDAYEYRPPVNLNDKSVEEVIWYKTLGHLSGGRAGVRSLAVDSQGRKLYWTHQRGAHPDGRVVRSSLDGDSVTVLVDGQTVPRDLVLDVKHQRMYWLVGIRQEHSLMAADLNGKTVEKLVDGLGRPNGLALDVDSQHLFYWEEPGRIIRVNTNGTGQELILDRSSDSLLHNWPRGMWWNSRDAKLYWLTPGGKIRRLAAANNSVEDLLDAHLPLAPGNFAINEAKSQLVLPDVGYEQLLRFNLRGPERELLAMTPRKADSQRHSGDFIAIDEARDTVYWTGTHYDGSEPYSAIYRMKLPSPLKHSVQPSPPFVAAVMPKEFKAGEILTITGKCLGDTKSAIFIDDFTGAHINADFQVVTNGTLKVTAPALDPQCLHPLIVVATPSGVTITFSRDIKIPKPGSQYVHDRFGSELMSQLWLAEPNLHVTKVENCVVVEANDAHFQAGSHGNNTIFVKNGCLANVQHSHNSVLYHEPFVRMTKLQELDPSLKLIAVPAVRPSFLEAPVTYQK